MTSLEYGNYAYVRKWKMCTLYTDPLTEKMVIGRYTKHTLRHRARTDSQNVEVEEQLLNVQVGSTITFGCSDLVVTSTKKREHKIELTRLAYFSCFTPTGDVRNARNKEHDHDHMPKLLHADYPVCVLSNHLRLGSPF